MTRARPTVPALDLYLAATMRPSEDLGSRLGRANVTRDMIISSRDQARAAGLANPAAVTTDLLLRQFGPPVRKEAKRWVYGLILWPDHEYEWELEEWGAASHAGFRLVHTVGLPGWLPPGAEHSADVFVPWLHTSHEVRSLLGDPEVDQSWGAAWGWHYAQSDGRDLVFDFDYGLLRETRTESAAQRDSEQSY